MIIMQTLDASARCRYIESNKLAKVIFAHELEDSVCIQYHPKGIKGSHTPRGRIDTKLRKIRGNDART
jgi:hypothetical protein